MDNGTQQRLEEIREREKKATKGPWHFQADTAGRPVRLHADDFDTVITRELNEDYLYMTNQDEAFIAHSREDIPFLLSHIDSLTNKLKIAEEAWQVACEIIHSEFCGISGSAFDDQKHHWRCREATQLRS